MTDGPASTTDLDPNGSARRPRRNRVTPFGEIIATPYYGMLMGNRGCLHDDRQRVVRHSANQRWIACVPTWPGVRRPLMAPGRYTELFFLDEATALAAGHRPCGECRHERLEAFKAAWAQAKGLNYLPKVDEIDAVLRAEQRSGKTMPLADIAIVPAGVMMTIAGSSTAWLWWGGKAWRWTPGGYEAGDIDTIGLARSLTLPSIIATLAAGYAVTAHGTALVA